MMGHVLVLSNVSGFLNKFEKDNVKILQSLGYTVHYAANMEEQSYEFDVEEVSKLGIVIHHINIERSPYIFTHNARAFLQLVKIVQHNDIRLIHCHTPVGGILGRLLGICCRKQKVKVMYTAHGFHFYKGAPFKNNTLYYMVERFFARFTDILIVINGEDYNSARRLRLRKNGLVCKIPGVGLDVERFQPLLAKERQVKRKELGIGEDEYFLVSVGELNENKNHIVVLRALLQMKRDKHRLDNIKYGICGSGFYKDNMPAWIKEFQLEDIVTLYGYRYDVAELVGCADAFIFPSIREGLGMAALEALALGIPVIASDNRGTREYMQHKKNGYICKYDDADDFVKGIEYIHDLNEYDRERIKSCCRQSVRTFDKRRTNKIMKQIYERFEEGM